MSSDHVEIGARVPRTHNPIARWIALRLLHLCGWHLDIRLPDQPKLVVLAAPHTSNWDGFFAILTLLALDLRMGLFAKHTMFRAPYGGFLHWVGVIPINRSAPGGVVGQTIEALKTREQLVIGLAPEGTRRRVEKWKRGFHAIALGSQVPIVCAYLDYSRKVVGTGLQLQPTADYAADLEKIQAFYRTITPKHPENFSASA